MIAAGKTDLLVLDELTALSEIGLVDPTALLGPVEARAPDVKLVVTGREAPPGLVDRADSATRMSEIVHPYQNGITPRGGIEY